MKTGIFSIFSHNWTYLDQLLDGGKRFSDTFEEAARRPAGCCRGANGQYRRAKGPDICRARKDQKKISDDRDKAFTRSFDIENTTRSRIEAVGNAHD